MKRRAGALCLAGLASLTLAASAHADTWNVTGTGDPLRATCNQTTKDCASLRAAVTTSNNNSVVDTINVPAGTISITDDLVIQSDITVIGDSARTTIIDGGAKSRGFVVSSSGIGRLSHLTIRNGASGQNGSNNGGGILNLSGTVTLDHVRITGSHAANGAAISNEGGTVTIVYSLLDNNVATGTGGAIYNLGGVEAPDRGLLAVGESTIFKNSGGNSADVGGIDSRGNAGNIVQLIRVTIADNTAGKGSPAGGLLLATGTGSANGVLMARNLAEGSPVNCGATKPANTVANVDDQKTCGFSTEGVVPGLATALTTAGGEIDVLALTAASPAVDLIPTANCAAGQMDARGMYRPQGPRCDAGAYELDQAATVTITDGPSGTVTSGDVQFGFNANEPGTTVQCQLTGPGQSGGFATCYKSNAQPYSGLADGTYTFSVRAVTSSFPNPAPTTQTFTVDTTPPDTTITGTPTNPTNDTTPTFTFTSNEAGSTFQCQITATAGYTACTSPYTPTLPAGSYTFRVRATDAAGLQDATPATFTFTIDTTPPDTTITSGPTGTVASTSAAFTYSSTKPTGATFQCALDGAAFSTCPASYTGLQQGSHTFQVRAIDAAGNVDPTPAARSWIVDTVGPDTTITGGPSGTVASTSATFTYSSTEPTGGSFQCSIDSGAFSTCPTGYTGLQQGSHTFQVRAIDAVGNADPTPASRTWIVDTVAPDTTIASGPSGPTASTSATFTFSSPESGVTFQCQLDSASGFATCPAGYTGLQQGAHTLQVRAIDAAGNVDPTPATRSWTVDTVPPDTTITGGPSGATASTSATFTYTSSEPAGATFQCALDGAAFGTCPASYTGLQQGSHTFQVRAIDAAGNADPTPAARTWNVDTVAPDTTINAPAPTPSNDTTPTFGFTSNEGTATFQCRIGTAAFATCPNPFTSAALAAGTYTFEVRALDAAGNVDPTPAAQTFVDRHDGTEHDDHQRAGEPDQRHDADVPVHLDGGRLDVRVPGRQRRLRDVRVRLHADARRRHAHGQRARDRPRRQRRRHAGDADVRDRHDGAEHHPHGDAADAGQQPATDVQLHRDRDRIDLRVPRRRRRLRGLHEPVHDGRAQRRRPHVRGPRGRPGGQRRRHAGPVQLLDRYGRAGDDADGSRRRARATTRRRRSPSRARARSCSAGSTPRPSPTARRPSPRPRSPPARTPSRSAPSTPPATPTRRPPRRRS